ncbi:hypothetical protein [Marisediminicola sp. LYQ85]|uniref:hypothetical protein n=1 Tax=Marisediminicola sp. LYQ85 TaxID=3391062 RepID=UPI00398363E0
MTDNHAWQSPEAAGPVRPSGSEPSYSPATTPATPPGAGPGANAGWTPPPKPGLIPLRPLEFGTILGAPYRLLRRNPRPTFGVSLLLVGVAYLLTFLVTGLVTFFAFSRIDSAASASDADDIAAGAVALIVLSTLVPMILLLVATAIMQAIVVLEVARQSLGEKLRFPQLWRLAKGRIGAVVGYTLVVTVIVLVALVAAIAVVVAAFVAGDAGIAIGIGLAVLLVLGGIVLTAWLTTKLAFVPSAIVLERVSIRAAISRSWRLTNNAFWRTFGTLLLVAIILNVASSIVSAPLQIAASFLPAILAPTGDETVVIVVLVVTVVVSLIATVVISAVILVIQSATTALLYLDQRIRKEGLDLDLIRYVEARQVGDAGARNPFETVRETA